MAVALKIFHSVGVGIAGFCLLDFGTALCDDQHIRWKFFAFAMECQLEAVHQERLKHWLLFNATLIEGQLAQLIGYGTSNFASTLYVSALSHLGAPEIW